MLKSISVVEEVAELKTTEIVVIERKGKVWRVVQAGTCIRDNNIFMTLLHATNATFKKLENRAIVAL